MSINNIFGRVNSGDVWAPGVELHATNIGASIPFDFETDAALDVQFIDPEDARKGVVIPRGRFVGFGSRGTAQALTDIGLPKLTLADGKNIAPLGISVHNTFRNTDKNMVGTGKPVARKGLACRVPYVVSINAAAGAIAAGDRLTAHFGSDDSTSVIASKHKGQVVKWTSKGVYQVHQAAGTACNLTSATNPGITPRVVAAWNGTAIYSGAAATYAYASGVWTATFATNVTDVIYEYGQSEAMIGGTALDLQSLVDLQNSDVLAKYVESTGGTPMAYKRRSVVSTGQTAATAENPTSLGGGQYRVAHTPIDPNYPITVWVKGTVVDSDGVATAYSADYLQLPVLSNNNRFKSDMFGQYHTVNWKTGVIELSANITVTAIRVAYTYEADPQLGEVAWGNGIQGVTDGSNLTGGTEVNSTVVVPTNPAGLPAYANQTDVVGVLRFWVN